MSEWQPRQRGLTLIELLVTLSIAVILVTIAVPSFQDFFRRNRLDTATSELITSMNLARSEAIRRGVRVTIRNTAGNHNWSSGWIMFVDTNGNGTQNAGQTPPEETLRVGQALPAELTIVSSSFQNFISYLPDGRSNGAGTFAICHGNNAGSPIPNRVAAVIVSMSGRARVAVDSNNPTDGIPNKDNGTNIGSCTTPASI